MLCKTKLYKLGHFLGDCSEQFLLFLVIFPLSSSVFLEMLLEVEKMTRFYCIFCASWFYQFNPFPLDWLDQIANKCSCTNPYYNFPHEVVSLIASQLSEDSFGYPRCKFKMLFLERASDSAPGKKNLNFCLPFCNFIIFFLMETLQRQHKFGN